LRKILEKKQQLWHEATRPTRACKQAALIITPSYNTKNDLITYFGIEEQKIKVMYPGIAQNFLESIQKITPEQRESIRKTYSLPKKFFLFLGTIEPRKNIETLLTAFENYLDQLPIHERTTSLVIAGAPGWNNTHLLYRLASSRHATYLHHLPYIPHEHKAGLYQIADLFIYPSIYEGFGFPALEAFTAGVPLITTTRGSLGEVAGEAAYYVRPHHASDITEAFHRFRQSPSLYQIYRERGYQQAAQFSYRIMAQNWLETIEQISQTSG
jgi:glycosyltransferase involved in cell wall biosynthesis